MTSAFGDQKVPMMTAAKNVGPGWHPILRDLEAVLNQIDPDFELLQVKEKFGGLRYYASTELSGDESDQFHTEIRMAEERSVRTCEECGKPGESYSSRHGYLKTLCSTHQSERVTRQKS